MGNPRIISGSAKGMRLRSVPGATTRPVTDRVKEALFNIIGADIVDSTLLDLFSGTGSIGIEALSRGARYVRLLDIAHEAVSTITANLTYTKLAGNADVIKTDSIKYLNKNPDRSFDYIYIAPPQYKGIWNASLLSLDGNPDWLSVDGWVIVQIHPTEYKEPALLSLNIFDKRRYGSTLMVFYSRA